MKDKKGKQPNFYKDIQDYCDEDRLRIIESGYEEGYQLTREKSHEAVITYEYYKIEKETIEIFKLLCNFDALILS